MKWIFIIILSLPAAGVISSLFTKSSPDIDSSDSFSMELSDLQTDLFISGYGILSNLLAICSVYLLQSLCREVYKSKLVKLLQAQDGIKLESLAIVHNSLNYEDPVIALFAAFRRSKITYLAYFVLMLSSVVNIYGIIVPMAITRFYSTAGEKFGQQNIPIPMLSNTSFGTANPFDSNGPSIAGKVPTSGFLTFLYFSQMPVLNTLFGIDLGNGTLPLTTFPFRSDDRRSGASDIIILNPMSLMSITVTDFNYKIVPKTGNVAGFDIFDRWNTSSIQDGSSISFQDESMYNCFQTQSAPWNNCIVPDSIPFTIVQKLPKVYGQYNFNSTIFYLPGASIPGYASTTPLDGQAAYVYSGTLKFRRSTVEGRRNLTSGIMMLYQVYEGETAEYGAPGKPAPKFRQFTSQEEQLFKTTKIAVTRLLGNSFKPQSAFSDRPMFTWNQLRELVSLDRLDFSRSSYTAIDFTNEIVRRLVCVTGSWIQALSLQDPSNTSSAPNNFLTISYKTGRIVKKASFGIPVLAGVVFVILWILLIILIFVSSKTIRKNRNEQLADCKVGEKDESITLDEAIAEISENAYGMAAFVSQKKDPFSNIVLRVDNQDSLVFNEAIVKETVSIKKEVSLKEGTRIK